MRPTKNPAQAETRGRPAGGEDRRGRRAELGGGLPALLGLGILLLSGCGASPPPGADAGGADAGPCAVDLECEDGLFCNGPERCAPGAPGASARGCLPASEPPCMPSQICDEEAASCLSQCDREPDADGDGARSVRCGGSDCDDADSSRHPGAIEICDAEGHDEDCDPSTLGPDEDGDGYAPGACCFLDPLTHTLFCGADCDDRSAEINPEAPESCNGADDNCDGRIDEEVSTLYYPDCDRDGFGQPGPGTSACATPSIAPVACEGIAGSSWSPRPTDCEDRNPAMHPGAAERCNDADDDCDGEVDEAGAELSCRLPGATLMRCAAGSCEVLSCAADLEDCDGIHSNGCESALLTSPDHCGSCGTVCAVAHGISTCVEGVCATAICEPGYHRCEQACVSNASLETCGEQCAPCPLAPRRGLGTSCDGLRCGVICAAGGYEAFGEGTESPECLWNDPTLASLVVSTGTLEPLGGGAAGFDPSILDHQIREILGVPSLALAPTSLAPDPSVDVILRVDGEAVPWGVFSAPIPLSLGWNVIQIEVLTDGGASRTYRLHVRRGVPAAAGSLRPASAQLGDLVGRSIAISGDTLVIGDAGEDGGSRGLGGDPLDDSALQSGAAYVFVWDSASQRWMEQAYLKASNADANDDFGADVAIEGDTIVIGAPGEASTARGVGGDESSNIAPDTGAAYVFVRDPATGAWTQQAYLKAIDGGSGARFGQSVSIADGWIAIGQPGADGPGLSDGGAIVTFRRAPGASSWSAAETLFAASRSSRAMLGADVSIRGGVLLGGAPGESVGVDPLPDGTFSTFLMGAGAAYVYELDSGIGSWSYPIRLLSPAPDAGDAFGTSVGLDASIALIGAPLEDGQSAGIGGEARDDSLPDSGAVYAFRRGSLAGEWRLETYLKAPNPDADDRFGTSIGLSLPFLVIGAIRERGGGAGVDGSMLDNSAPFSGAAYVLLRDPDRSQWQAHAYLKANVAGTRFLGTSVAIDGGRIFVGTGSSPGDAHVFTLD